MISIAIPILTEVESLIHLLCSMGVRPLRLVRLDDGVAPSPGTWLE